MALTKQKKAEIVAEVKELFENSKLTVIVKYPGTSVKSMQQLRSQAGENGTIIKVVKNRLVKKALEATTNLKSVDGQLLEGQLLYAFNSNDEVAPAQSLANFIKEEPQITFVGAIAHDGNVLSAEDVKALASLPGKDQLRAQLVGTIGAPLSGFVHVLSGNIRGVLNVLTARAEAIK